MYDFIFTVSTANEGAEDSKLITTIAHMGKRKIMELKTDTHHFSANEFVDKLVCVTCHFIMIGNQHHGNVPYPAIQKYTWKMVVF